MHTTETRRSVRALRWATLFVGAVVTGALWASPVLAQDPRAAPEAATGVQGRAQVVAERQLVVAANPHAAAAGRDILRAGGNAIDAAIAVQLVLGLVEPQSSGLGGGAFLLHFDAATKSLRSYDGRETAPAAARGDRFLIGGRPMPFDTAVRSGLSVGVPGVVKLMELAHQRHGTLPWERLFAPAIQLAEEGFAMSPRLHALLQREAAERFSPAARAYFFDGTGAAWPVGHRLKNPAYAQTLRLVATGGARVFYESTIAQEMTAAVAGAPFAPGDLTLSDFAAYRAIERSPVCVAYRSTQVCGMGPPSSGGLAIGQALMLLDGFAMGRAPTEAMRPADMHVMAEAMALAFADRNWYVADPERVAVPPGLLDPGYISERRRLIDPARPMAKAYPGTPPAATKLALGDDNTVEVAGTTHLSIIDAAGNAVSMTSSIEAGFGSRLWAAGFLLNNQLTDFAFRPVDREKRAVANRVEGGKRPRSSMAPTIVLDEAGLPVIVTGSPGGSRIIPYVLKSLVGLIDWKLEPQQAAELTNFGNRGSGLEIEMPLTAGDGFAGFLSHAEQTDRALRYAIGLRPHGHTATFDEMTSGLHIIVRRRDGRLAAGVDPRREGAAMGD